MTFNIHHGVGVDGGLDLDRVAATVAAHQPDVVGLQKVDRHWSGRSGFVDKARVLARRHGMRLAYGAAVDADPPAPGATRRRFGNAVLSRFPIISRTNMALPRTSDVEPRALLCTRVDRGSQALDVYITHLNPHDRRQRSLQAGLSQPPSPAVPTPVRAC